MDEVVGGDGAPFHFSGEKRPELVAPRTSSFFRQVGPITLQVLLCGCSAHCWPTSVLAVIPLWCDTYVLVH